MKTLSLFFLLLGPLANANRLTFVRAMPRDDRMSLEPLENFAKLIVGRLPGKLFREGACLPAFPRIVRPNCRAILINREGRQIVAVFDERSLRIAIIARR